MLNCDAVVALPGQSRERAVVVVVAHAVVGAQCLCSMCINAKRHPESAYLVQQESGPAHFAPSPLVISPRTTVGSGGVGTFDELWEGVAEVSLGFRDVPIVCVNVNGYYDSFQQMLERAFADKLIYRPPNDLLGMEPTASMSMHNCMLVRCSAQRVSGTSSTLSAISHPLSTMSVRASARACTCHARARAYTTRTFGYACWLQVCVRAGWHEHMC